MIRDYYRYLDEEIGSVLELLTDDTIVLVVSDHGARRLDGGFCVNEWLIREGLLVLNQYPEQVTPFAKLDVNWEQDAGLERGRLLRPRLLQREGPRAAGRRSSRRTTSGSATRSRRGSRRPTDADGKPLGTLVFRPEEIYRTVRNVAPDLIVHFGGLAWRSIGGVGYPTLHVQENDTGPDDCNHAQHGAFILAASNNPLRGESRGRTCSTSRRRSWSWAATSARVDAGHGAAAIAAPARGGRVSGRGSSHLRALAAAARAPGRGSCGCSRQSPPQGRSRPTASRMRRWPKSTASSITAADMDASIAPALAKLQEQIYSTPSESTEHDHRRSPHRRGGEEAEGQSGGVPGQRTGGQGGTRHRRGYLGVLRGEQSKAARRSAEMAGADSDLLERAAPGRGACRADQAVCARMPTSR